MVDVIGEILVDIFKDETKCEVFPGGAPFNVASNIKLFGGSSSFYGAVGKDEYGKFLKKYARKVKFDNLVLKTLSKRETTQALVTLTNGERSFKFVRDNGADYALSIRNIEKLNINKGDIVHIGSLMLSFSRGRRFFYKLVDLAKEKGALISFDINYRDDIFENEQVAKRIFKKAMLKADYLKISDEELKVLSKKKKFESSVKDLVKDNQVAFISLGSKGSCVYRNNSFVFEDTIKVSPIDTTGAGDAFYSYVLFELDNNKKVLQNESLIHKMLKRANAVGAIATLKKGAIGVAPTIEELNSYLGE